MGPWSDGCGRQWVSSPECVAQPRTTEDTVGLTLSNRERNPLTLEDLERGLERRKESVASGTVYIWELIT